MLQGLQIQPDMLRRLILQAIHQRLPRAADDAEAEFLDALFNAVH
jgi:hypothetical protein